MSKKIITPPPLLVSKNYSGAWYDAADTRPSSIIQSGGFASKWIDKFGFNNSAEQAVGASQPRTGLNTINGLNTLTFDGTDDYLQKLNFSSATSITIFFVVRPTLASLGTSSLFAFESTNDFQIAPLGPGGQFFGNIVHTGLGISSLVASTNMLGGVYLYMLQLDADTGIGTIKVNGVQEDTDTGYNGSLTTTQDLIISGNRGRNAFLGCDMGEIIFYNKALSASEIFSIENYLNNKWGLY